MDNEFEAEEQNFQKTATFNSQIKLNTEESKEN